MKDDFFEGFSKNCQIPNLTKIRPVTVQMFHVDRQVTKLIVASRNFGNAPKNYFSLFQ